MSEPRFTDAEAVAALLQVLDVQLVAEDCYRGYTARTALGHVFGGQVAGQALVAAGRTVPAERAVHSMHSYFIRSGDPEAAITFRVERVRDGGSFSVRRVVAEQHGDAIFVMSASYQLPQPGVEHQWAMPDVPAPEGLPTMSERYADSPGIARFYDHVPRPFDVRYVDDPPWIQRDIGPRKNAETAIWMKANACLGDDPLVHACALAFASDLDILDAVLLSHALDPRLDPMVMASLDHVMWFHRQFRADEWFLYVIESPSAAGGRGLGSGRFFSHDGRLIASVAQEGLVRLTSS